MSTMESTELQLSGRIYRRGEAGYEELRAGGIKPERYPAQRYDPGSLFHWYLGGELQQQA